MRSSTFLVTWDTELCRFLYDDAHSRRSRNREVAAATLAAKPEEDMDIPNRLYGVLTKRYNVPSTNHSQSLLWSRRAWIRDGLI